MNIIERLFEGIRTLFDAAQYEEAEPVLVERPYIQEHACRLKDPGDFVPNSFRRIKQGDLSIIIGKLKGETTTTAQAYRYAKENWSMDKASAHCQKAKGSFEAAKEERAIALSTVAEQVRTLIKNQDQYAWLNDLYDDAGQLIGIVTSQGKLYRVPIMIQGTNITLGTMQAVEQQFSPVREGGFSITRMADGKYRWFAVAESAVLNRVNEIDSRALFDSFVDNSKSQGMPELRFYHDPRLHLGLADYIVREEALYLASGLLDEAQPLAQQLIAAQAEGRGKWGTSVGFVATVPPTMVEISSGVSVPVYTAGFNREISVLPEERAASWFTLIETEVNTMRDEVRRALVTLFGDEQKAESFITAVDGLNREIADKGLITRDATAEVATTETVTVAEGQANTTTEEKKDDKLGSDRLVIDEATLDAIAGRVKIEAPKIDLSAIESVLKDIRGRLDILERSDDEKRRGWQADMPARGVTNVTYRPREDKEKEGATPTSSAQIAEATLARMPKR